MKNSYETYGDRQKPRLRYCSRIGIPCLRYEIVMETSEDEIDRETNIQSESITSNQLPTNLYKQEEQHNSGFNDTTNSASKLC